MDTLNYISMSLDLFCIVVSLIIFLSLLMESERRSRLNRLFRNFVLCNIGIVSSDVVAWLTTGNTKRYAYFFIRISNYFHYVFGALILAAIAYYMLAYIEQKMMIPRGVKHTITFICAASVLLTTISQFTHMYYIIDENNVYHRQGFYLLSQSFSVAVLIINIGIVFFYRKVLERRAALFFTIYMVLPAVAIVIQALFYGITLVNIASTLTMLILYIGVQTEQSKNMESNIMVMGKQLEFQSEHYKRLQAHIADTKRARHDLRHHLSVFQSYINAGEIEKLAAYVNKYAASLPDDTEIAFCENYAVNSILRYYISMAKNEGIQVDTHLELPENTGASDSDLCIIFGNCVENAIEACRNVDEGKYIRINSQITGKMLAITIDNSFDGVLKKEDVALLSRKHEGDGVGTSSVRAVARNYGGEVLFETKDDLFQTSVMLRLK